MKYSQLPRSAGGDLTVEHASVEREKEENQIARGGAFYEGWPWVISARSVEWVEGGAIPEKLGPLNLSCAEVDRPWARGREDGVDAYGWIPAGEMSVHRLCVRTGTIPRLHRPKPIFSRHYIIRSGIAMSG